MRERVFQMSIALAVALWIPAFVQAQVIQPPKITFEEAISRALKNNPGIAEASQAILRAEALLQQAETIFRPTLSGNVTTVVLDNERGFDQFVTQPRVQSLLAGAVSYPVFAASSWAASTQARDQVQVSRLSASEIRQQIAVATAQAYLAVIASQRQLEVQSRARENALAHLDYARARLEGGVGSKLNELRAAQELSTVDVLVEAVGLLQRRAQEALGVLVAADGPLDAAAEPVFEQPEAPVAADWIGNRPDVQLFSAQVRAADRVYRDSWRDWVPSATAAFESQLVTPSGLFQPVRTWRGLVAVSVPIFDAGERRAIKRQRQVALDTARIQLTDIELRAKAELRTAYAAVESIERAVAHARLAAQHADDVLRITDIAFRAGATTNIELVDAQRRARDLETAAAEAEDRLRQARLELLVALGRFP